MIFLISLIAFVSSNIDDIIILTVLFAQAVGKKDRVNILIGQYVGIFTLLFVSFVIATFLVKATNMPLNWLFIVPMLLGINKLIEKKNNEDFSQPTISIFQVVILTIASGADNIGIYIPMIIKQSLNETVIFLIVFALMVPIWWFVGKKIGSLETIKKMIKKNEKLVVTLIYFVIGIWIIFG